MIIHRYLVKEQLQATLAVSVVIILLFLSNEIVRYLSHAVSGNFAFSILFKFILIELPLLAGLLLPLGTYLGILLAYGRLYADNEITVLYGCGFSRARLTRTALLFSFGVMIVVACLVMWVSPYMAQQRNAMYEDTRNASVVETLMPGQFQASRDGKKVYYVERMSRDRKKVKNIFVAQQEVIDNDKPATEDNLRWWVLSSESGYEWYNPKLHVPYMVAMQGYRYAGKPGEKEYRIEQFEEYGFRIEEGALKTAAQLETDAMPTSLLFLQAKSNREAMAELQWRIAVPISVIILALLAVPLSRVKPRQGKYSRLFPAMLIYLAYANGMFIARAAIEKEQVSALASMWWLPLLGVIVAAMLYINPEIWRKLWRSLWIRKRAV